MYQLCDPVLLFPHLWDEDHINIYLTKWYRQRWLQEMSTIITVHQSTIFPFWELTMSIINLSVCMFIIQPSLFSIMGSPWGQWSCLSYPFLYTTRIAQCLEPRRCSRNSWMRNVLKWAFPGIKPWGDPGSPGTSQGAGQMALLCISFSPW